MAEIEIEIDGKKLSVRPDQTVIQAADAAGIYIPRFCYHKQLSIAANCRMCLVEVEKSPKTLPACATPVTPGMKVFTQSPKTIEAQRAVMEFLLINHPLDCPICDQGGECELQDLAMGYGSSHSCYDESKRAVADQDLGPLIATEMTRCIYCTRCVRFGEEIAGLREMGALGRGEMTEIGTYVQQAVTSEVSGNIIDLCPVGALTSKPYRFTARPFELDQAPSVSPHDCVGSNLYVHSRYGTVMRVVSRENPAVNENWIADRDRFSYTGLYHADRLEQPLAKIDGEWQVVEWQKALEIAAKGLQDTISEQGADKLGALASPNATLEEFYLLQKLVRGLGSPHIDHRLRSMDNQDQTQGPLYPGLGMSFTEFEQCDAVLLIGSNLQKEQPLAALRLRKAALKGTTVLVVNPMDYRFNFPVTAKKIVAPHVLTRTLAAMVNVMQPEFSEVAVDEVATQLVSLLRDKRKPCIVLGALASNHPKAADIRYLAQRLAILTGAHLGTMTEGANSAGGFLAGAIPHRHMGGSEMHHVGLDAHAMLNKARKAYLLLNVEPDLDCANAFLAQQALKQAQCVVALASYRHPLLMAHAHVILPITPFTETAGTFVNAAGEWQSFTATAKPFATSRPAWKVLRVLGNFLHLDGFDYESAEAIKKEVKMGVEKARPLAVEYTRPNHFSLSVNPTTLSRIGEIPLYALDSLVRRAQPLQDAQTLIEGDVATVRIHPHTAKKLGLREGECVTVKQQANAVSLPWIADTRVAEQALWVAGGITATCELGDLFGGIEKC